MIDWHEILKEIYSPPIGSLWVAPNGIWNNSFAHNKDKDDFHPSVIGRLFENNHRCWLIPGTSKDYKKGSDVFNVKIDPEDPDCPYSHFLIKLRMVYTQKMCFCWIEDGMVLILLMNNRQKISNCK